MSTTAALLSAAALALVSCGGDGDGVAERATTTAPTVDASSVREVNAEVGGRTLNGHCRGGQGENPAVLLEGGIASDQNQLAAIEERLAERTVSCAYDRAGVGASDPPPKTPRSVTEVVADADAFVTATNAEPPYVLVGQSAGATIAFMYAQAYPDKVAGFVAMNPVPPSKPFLAMARKVETKEEFEGELAFYRGENDEGITFSATERMLTDPLPPTMPYAVMFDEDCGGDTGSVAGSFHHSRGPRRCSRA